VTEGCAAVAAWQPPGRAVPAPVGAAVEAEVARLAGERAEPASARQAEAAAAALRPQRPHRYLEVLGTRPDRQGQGLGGAVLRPGLDRCDEGGLLAWTDTSSPENVAFYARFGFGVRASRELPGGGPPLWALGREPRAGRPG
jgi:GNAT superfamily N-acetyltransferase